MFAFTNTNGISRMHMHYHAFHYSDRVFLQHTTAWTRIVAAMFLRCVIDHRRGSPVVKILEPSAQTQEILN